MRSTSMTGPGAVALTVALAVLHGCGGGGGGGGGGGVGPTISNEQVSPSVWSSGGGNATIQADVTDPSGVSSVSAEVTGPSGATSVSLTMSSGSSRYTGQYAVRANQTMGGSAQVYSVVVTATGTDGGKTSAPTIRFSVPAPDQPPSPPSQG